MKNIKNKLFSMEEVDKAMGWTDKQLERINQDTKYKSLAYNIKKLRETEGLTQQQLATKTGFPRTMITRMESGRSNITVDTLMCIAKSIGKEVEIKFVEKKNLNK